MTINVYRHLRDLAILWKGQQSDTDTRVPTAEELAATEDVLRGHLVASRQIKPLGLTNRPILSGLGQTVTIANAAIWSHRHPTLGALPVLSLAMPPLSAGTAINRYDYIYLITMAIEVGAAQDANVNLSFQWRSGTVLQTVVRENTARVRSAYGLWVSQGEMTASAIATAIGASVTANFSSPTVYGSSRLYWVDSTFADGTTYALSGPIEVISLARIWRLQNTLLNGYSWGAESLDNAIHIQPSYTYVGEGWDNWPVRLQETIWQIMRGEALQNSPTQIRSVYNLVNGQVGGNSQAPGNASTSPNGSPLLANEQRISFTNQAIAQTTGVVSLLTTDDGTGKSVASVAIASNSPVGTTFAASGHKLFNSAGADISSLGTFAIASGTLTWTATVAGTPVVESAVYLVPAINYPSGSGLPVCGAIERVYLASAVLSAANVRESDITAYQEPANAETYIVIMNRANAAIRWIYKKFTVTSSNAGVVSLPAGSRGLIAWISGANAPAGRQDKAVITGLSNSTSYDLLCYYAPPATEQWQFQLRSPAYAGTKDLSYLSNALIETEAIAFAHSLGGGTTINPAASRPWPDGLLSNACIAWQLPKTSEPGSVRDYNLDAEIQYAAGFFNRLAPFAAIPFPGAEGQLASLQPGRSLTTTSLASIYDQSLSLSLAIDGANAGVLKPALSNSKAYQLVIACGIVKNGEHRVLVLTCNQGTVAANAAIAFSSDTPNFVGIDSFRYY